MEEAIKEYLEKAAAVKKMINTQLWNFSSMRWKLAQWDITIYYALVSLIFVFKGTLAFVEDYPGRVKKPSQVWWIDFATVIADFIFVLLQSFKPDIFEFWHAGTGITGFASKVGRAYIIASYTTPLTPISTTRNRFNAFGPAVVTGMKAVLALMALPREKLPLAGPGEPFSSLVNCGKGLTNADRCKLLGVILSSMQKPFPPETIVDCLF